VEADMIQYRNYVMCFYNIHTHFTVSEPNIHEIVNCIIEKQKYLSLDALLFYSVGIHPWYIYNIEEQIHTLKSIVARPNVLAIGEIGLDKLSNVPFDIQQAVFKESAQVAEKERKPLIIHCVKAWGEIVGLKKQIKPAVPWIIHGFRGNSELAKQLLDQGLYLSFGEQFQTKALQKTWDNSRLLAETDDKKTDIRAVYHHIATTLAIPLEELTIQIEKNTKALFPSLLARH